MLLMPELGKLLTKSSLPGNLTQMMGGAKHGRSTLTDSWSSLNRLILLLRTQSDISLGVGYICLMS